MLTRYLESAMQHAGYEEMPDGRIFGRIEECPGMWAVGGTREVCRIKLRAALEGWLLLKLRHDDEIPPIRGIDLLAASEYEFMRNNQLATPLPNSADDDAQIDEHVLERFLVVAGIDPVEWDKRGN